MRLTLEPAPPAEPDGLLAEGPAAGGLLAKLSSRRRHYAQLALAQGRDWLVLWGQGDLPFVQGATPLAERAPGLLTPSGLAPSLPQALWPRLAPALRGQNGGTGPLALLPGPRLLDLSRAAPLGDVDLAAL